MNSNRTRKKHGPTSIRVTKHEPWHVLKYLSVIADAIAEFIEAPPAELMRRICENRRPVVLAAGLNQKFEKLIHIEDIGTASIRELALRTLRNSGLGHAADELDSRLSTLLNRLRSWETKWRDTIRLNGSMIAAGQQIFPHYRAEAIAYLGDDASEARDEFAEIEAYAEGTVAMLRQLIAERTEKLKSETQWSKPRSKSNWVRLLKDLGVEISSKTFRRHLGVVYRQHPDTKTTAKMVKIDISTLPTNYSEAMSLQEKRSQADTK